MFCVKCGKEIDDKADVCIHCGVYTESQKKVINDSPSGWLALFSFFFPVIGLILYLVYESSRPARAKSLKKGTIAGFITYGILAFLFIAAYVILFVVIMADAFMSVF